MADALLEIIKRRLEIPADDILQDQVISDIIDEVSTEFKLLTGATSVPDKFNFIITEITLKRYNRRGNEGMSHARVEGHAITYEKPESDFSKFRAYLRIDYPEIDDHLNVVPGELNVW